MRLHMRVQRRELSGRTSSALVCGPPLGWVTCPRGRSDGALAVRSIAMDARPRDRGALPAWEALGRRSDLGHLLGSGPKPQWGVQTSAPKGAQSSRDGATDRFGTPKSAFSRKSAPVVPGFVQIGALIPHFRAKFRVALAVEFGQLSGHSAVDPLRMPSGVAPN